MVDYNEVAEFIEVMGMFDKMHPNFHTLHTTASDDIVSAAIALLNECGLMCEMLDSDKGYIRFKNE